MAKLDRRKAFYTTGEIVEGKTKRKQFDTENLIGILSYYDDGTRVVEDVPVTTSKRTLTTDTSQITKLLFEANKQFKYDGGDTPEIKHLRRGQL